jgi:hypothetical protein
MADELVATPAEYAEQESPTRRPLVPPLPVWLVVAAALLASAAIFFFSDLDKAQANILVLIFMFTGAMTIAVWFSVFSGYPNWLRWSFVGLALAVIALWGICYRIEGTTGWMVPKFAWRFAPKPDELLNRTPIADGAKSTAAAIDIRTSTPDDFPRFLGPAASGALDGGDFLAELDSVFPCHAVHWAARKVTSLPFSRQERTSLVDLRR